MNYAKTFTWLLVNVFCLSFWVSTYSVVSAEYSRGLQMPPAKYDRKPSRKPIVVYAKLRQTNRICRNNSTAAIGRGRSFYGCAMRIVGGRDKGRYLVYVATDAPVPAKVILRHEYGHVNGWRH